MTTDNQISNAEDISLPPYMERSDDPTTNDRLNAEGRLLWHGISAGVTRELSLPAAVLAWNAATSALGAAVLAYCAVRSPGIARVTSQVLKYGTIIDIGDRALSAGDAAIDTWINPEHEARNSKKIADTLGAGLADYAVLGIPAFGAYKQTSKYLDISAAKMEAIFAAADQGKFVPSLKHDWFNNLRPELRTAESEPALNRYFAKNLPGDVSIETTFKNKNGKVTGSGSGFIATSDGLVVTNYHVVSGASSATVVLANGEQYSGRLIARDRKADLALLKLDDLPPGKQLRPVVLGSSRNLEKGDVINMIGHPDGIVRPVLSEGRVTGRTLQGYIAHAGETRSEDLSNWAAGRQNVLGLNLKLPHLHGNSGSALRDEQGRVVGIFTWGDRIEGGGTSVEHVSELLRAGKQFSAESGWLNLKTSVSEGGVVSTISQAERSRVDLAMRVNERVVDNKFAAWRHRPYFQPAGPALSSVNLAGGHLAIDRIGQAAWDLVSGDQSPERLP